jgi:hypothetical protein
MDFFGFQNINYPRSWKEMSFDFKLMFLDFGGYFLLFACGSGVSLVAEVIFASLLAIILIIFSIRHRLENHWRWPGASSKNIYQAFIVTVFEGLFVFAALQIFPLTHPSSLPWYLSLASIGLFNILVMLQIVDLTETDFKMKCFVKSDMPISQAIDSPSLIASDISETILAESEVPESNWKKRVKRAYGIFFFLVWLEVIALLYFSSEIYRNGSSIQTSSQTAPLVDHGQVVYITQNEKLVIDVLQAGSCVGIPAAVILGLLLQRVFRVMVFPEQTSISNDDKPSMWDRWEKRGKD